MMTASSHRKLSFAFLCFLSLGLVAVASPAKADEATVITEPKPFIVPTGQLRDLQGIESKTQVGDLGSLKGENEVISTSSVDNPYEGRKIIVFYPSRQEAQPESSLRLEPEPTLIGDLTIDQILSEMVGQPDRSTIQLHFR